MKLNVNTLTDFFSAMRNPENTPHLPGLIAKKMHLDGVTKLQLLKKVYSSELAGRKEVYVSILQETGGCKNIEKLPIKIQKFLEKTKKDVSCNIKKTQIFQETLNMSKYTALVE
ncbi:MAG: hypothetical protein ACPGTS_00305 [Minisyncoccia bacterium]